MKRIYINEPACIGCHLCEVFCRAGHARSRDLVKALKRESPPPVPRLRVEVQKQVSFSVQCRQCDEPPCVYACLTGALRKEPETGVVAVDETKCVGCWTCIVACPFGAIRRDINLGKVAKCDLCPGRETPLCVANCPNEALVWAETDGVSGQALEKVR